MPYRLSVLDQSPIPAGGTAADAVRDTLDLARAADALGYHRYWLAEHHATPALAGAAPEALIGPVALATRTIRVGSGGIMLPHYSPFKVAETFALLAAMAPGRIDLGLGRAPGSDGRAALAMQRDRSRRLSAHDFPDQLDELLGYLGDGLEADHLFAPLADTLPTGGGVPQPWLLGSSPDSAALAARLGLPYCFADFINSEGAGIVDQYRRVFQPSRWAEAPQVLVGIWTIAAPTTAEAERLALPAACMFSHMMQGRLIPVPSMADALAWAHANPALAHARRRRTVLGTPAEVRRGLDAAAAEYDADELLLVNILPEHAARRRSYALVAGEYALVAPALAA